MKMRILTFDRYGYHDINDQLKGAIHVDSYTYPEMGMSADNYETVIHAYYPDEDEKDNDSF